MIVSPGSPEAMEQFNPSEIGDTDQNGLPEFLDGWGRPIRFLRWAPGCSANHTTNGVVDGYSDIQSGDPKKILTHSTLTAQTQILSSDQTKWPYHLIPLIYSEGVDPLVILRTE